MALESLNKKLDELKNPAFWRKKVKAYKDTLEAPKEIGLSFAFTSFFSTLLAGIIFSYESVILSFALLGFIILLEGISLVGNILKMAGETKSIPKKAVLYFLAGVLSALVISVLGLGSFAGVALGLVAAPFVFLGVMSYIVGLNAYRAWDEFKKWRNTKKLIAAVDKKTDENLIFAPTEQENIIKSLVSKTLYRAYKNLSSKITNENNETKLFDLKDKDGKGTKLRDRIAELLKLDFEDAKGKNITLAQAQELLILEINSEGKKYTTKGDLAYDLLDTEGKPNSEFFNNRDVVKEALKQAKNDHGWRAMYFVGQSLLFGTVGTTIAVCFEVVTGAIAKFAVPLLGLSVGALAVNTGYKVYKEVSTPEKKEDSMSDRSNSADRDEFIRQSDLDFSIGNTQGLKNLDTIPLLNDFDDKNRQSVNVDEYIHDDKARGNNYSPATLARKVGLHRRQGNSDINTANEAVLERKVSI